MSSFLSSFSRLSLLARPTLASTSTLFAPSPLSLQVRHKSLLPRKTKYRKSHKGRIPIALGGSTKGTTLEWGEYGLRVNEPCRLSAKHLESAEAALKRGLKPYKGCKVSVCASLAFFRRRWREIGGGFSLFRGFSEWRSGTRGQYKVMEGCVLIHSLSKYIDIYVSSPIFQFVSKCVFSSPTLSYPVLLNTILISTRAIG